MKRFTLILPVLLLICCTGINFCTAQSQLPQNHNHDFDFWLGEWDVYKFGTDTLVGKSEIESILDSVGILENYHSVRGKYQGKSLNKYNPANQRWEQYWIDNSGLTLFLNGDLSDGKMVMSDSLETSNDQSRIIWTALPDGTVRQIWEQRKTAGGEWVKVFDGVYRRR